MIICDAKRTSKFKDVLYGSVFLWNGHYYMRTQMTYYKGFEEFHPRNAVQLEDGSSCYFEENEIVHDVNGHFEAY